MPRKGDSAWFATFTMKVLAALAGLEDGPVCQVTQERAQRVWINTAKATTRSLTGGKQHRDVYSLALIQLEQHEGGDADRYPQEANDEEVDGSMRCSGSQSIHELAYAHIVTEFFVIL